MIESPIRRKYIQYPKDFLPASDKPTQPKRFTFNEDYQIDAHSLRKYQKSIEEPSNDIQQPPQALTRTANPQRSGPSGLELEQDSPLSYHQIAKIPSLDEDLLKKPRFSLNDKEEIAEKEEGLLENSASPGSIRKQLQNRQHPLRLEDPCKIQLLRSTSKTGKALNSCIKFRSSSDFHNKSWASSQKDIMRKFQESRSKIEVPELPKLSRHTGNHNQQSFAGAREQYETFRRKQQSLGGSYGKVSSLLSSMKKKEVISNSQLPKFQPHSVQRLKEQINSMVKAKKGRGKKEQSEQEQNQRQSSSQSSRRSNHYKRSDKQKNSHPYPSKMPELLISYRSSLSYLKDLYVKSRHLSSWKLVVKIPKIFAEKLIFKQQDRQELYETATSIFEELRIPYENLVIKKYTNCTMMVARNVCLIWHYDGRRYLGGWQSDYLDEGFKHGLGLQWEPKKYVYYGEFVRNKKQGLGIYKDRDDSNYIGYWNRGQKMLANEAASFGESSFHQESEQMYEGGSEDFYQYQYF